MFKERLNKNEIQILRHVMATTRSTTAIAKALEISLSWTSECITHLEEMGLVITNKRGVTQLVSRSESPFAYRLHLLISEVPQLNLDLVLAGPGLKILPYLLEPGSTLKAIASSAGISERSVKDTLKRWMGMGVAIKKKDRYSLNPRQKHLVEMTIAFSEQRNGLILKGIYPEALIVWQWGDAFMFTIGHSITHVACHSASTSRAQELGYDVISTSAYYYYDPNGGDISEEEALVQGMITDPNNPRSQRNIRYALENKRIDIRSLRRLGRKYKIKVFDKIIK